METGMQPDCDLLPIKRTFVSQSKRLFVLFLLSHDCTVVHSVITS